jgi:hypothetical protein
MSDTPGQHAPGGKRDAWPRVRSKREAHLLELARNVERDDPVLACELRGMALHEAALASSESFMPAAPPALWRRLAERWTPQPGWR